MSDAALEIVFDHFYARRRRDIAAVADGLDPAVVHQGVMPLLVCNGRDAVVERVTASFDDMDDRGVERLAFLAAGDQVIVNIAGPRFREIPFLDGEIFMLFSVRDGRIARIDDFRTLGDAQLAAESRRA
jgi:ketosteroid isomerase-like protein